MKPISIRTFLVLSSIASSSVEAWSSSNSNVFKNNVFSHDNANVNTSINKLITSSTSTSLFESSYSNSGRGRDMTNNQQEEASSSQSSSRRNLLLLTSSTLAAATASAAVTNKNTKTNLTIPVFNNNKINTMNIAQAVQWIDDHCDRRYLHAVIASDYHFLYRGVPNLKPKQIQTERLTPDLLLEGTYGNDNNNALEFFQTLQNVLQNEVINPSNGHLATSSKTDAEEWGVAGSIWPMNSNYNTDSNGSSNSNGFGGEVGRDRGAHYAWFNDKQLFYPRPSTNTNTILSRENIIIDGKDCGKESLEDALRAESCEVLIASEEFLVVPASMDSVLRDALKNSFLV